GQFVVGRGRVAVGADGRIHGLPNIKMLAGAAVGAKAQFEMAHLVHVEADHAIAFAYGGDGNGLEWPDQEIGVGVVVEIRSHVTVEIDGVGTEGPGAVVKIGIENLHGERFPSSGRTAGGDAGPTLADAAKLFFDGGEKFL